MSSKVLLSNIIPFAGSGLVGYAIGFALKKILKLMLIIIGFLACRISFIPLLDSFTIILLLAALGIFVWLAAKSKDIRSFQFQISIFIVIWVLGQVAGSLQDNGTILLSPFQGDIVLEIHVVSLFFSIMVWLRFYFSQRSLWFYVT